MNRLWILLFAIGMMVSNVGYSVTGSGELVEAEGTIDYVTASSVSRAQSEVQIRLLKQLLISKKVDGSIGEASGLLDTLNQD